MKNNQKNGDFIKTTYEEEWQLAVLDEIIAKKDEEIENLKKNSSRKIV